MKVFVLCLISLKIIHAIDWNGNWAMGCDFRDNDFTNVQIPGEQCGGRCAATEDCTHFAWNDYLGGTCWMKRGSVSKNDAFDAEGVVCGLLEDKMGGGAHKVDPVCLLKIDPGDIQVAIAPKVLWAYNAEEQRCQTFNFIRGGNANKFRTKEDCENACGRH